MDNLNKIKKSRENLIISFNLSFVCLLGFIQDIIFNVEHVGLREEKTITVTKALRETLPNLIGKDFFVTPNKNSLTVMTETPEMPPQEIKMKFEEEEEEDKY